MRKLREVLRLHALGQSKRAIGRSLKISHNTAALYLRRADEAGIRWPAIEELDDRAIEALLIPAAREPGGPYPTGRRCIGRCAGRA
jgi:hypothetical protein